MISGKAFITEKVWPSCIVYLLFISLCSRIRECLTNHFYGGSFIDTDVLFR